MKKINWKKLVIIVIITFVVGSFFNFFTMNNMDTFKELEKPINVPGILFPIVWSILYLLMSISLYIVTNKTKNNKPLIVYGVQLIINSLWSLIFFGFGAYLFAFIWIILLVISIIVMMVTFYKIDKKSFYLNIPYLLWTVFAGYLTLGIYMLNK